MKMKFISLIGALIIQGLSGCISNPMALGPVRPNPISPMVSSQKGYLQVFSAIVKSIPMASDDPTTFNLHSSYDIYDESGKALKYVPNHASNMDESPDQASLASGNYYIIAESSCCGSVKVPVVIQTGKTTVVHLDSNAWQPSNTPTNQLVFLPDGEVVGWSSSASKASR